MPLYSYFARSVKGEEKSGVVEIENIQQLSQSLKGEGFILIKAEPQKIKKNKSFLNFLGEIGTVPLTEKLMFTRNLQVMVSSGLSLPRSLDILALQSKNKKFKKVLSQVKEKLVKGKNFSDALTEHPGIFSDLFQNMIKVGEETGGLDESLKILSRQLEREHDLKSKIKGALIYPAIIVMTMIGIGILMLVMVVPQLADTFEELGIELPLTTRVVIGLGTFLNDNGLLSVIIILVFAFLFWLILRTKPGKRTIDAIFLKIPIISTLVKKTNSARTIRTLSSLIASGVPIVKSLEIVAGTLGNVYYKEAILQAMERVKKGEKLSLFFKSCQSIYSPIVFQMIEVGEETGETSTILAKLADFFEEEIGNATQNMAAVIEPVLMLIIGAAIGFFAISMVQPMYSMLGGI